MARKPTNAKSMGPVNRPQTIARSTLTPFEQTDWTSQSYNRPIMTTQEARDFETRSLRKSRGQSNPAKSSKTLTQSERGDATTKSLKQFRENPPKATKTASTATAPTASKTTAAPKTAAGGNGSGKPPAKPPATTAGANASGGPLAKRGGTSPVPASSSAGRIEKVVSGSHEMVRPNALPGAARVGGMTKFMSKIPVIGAIIGAAVGGNAVKDEPGTLRARTDLVNWYASKTGSEANADSMNAPTRYTVKPRETVVAPGGTSPVVPSKTLSATPVAPTPKGSSSPTSSNARTAYHKPSNASGSKGRAMSGAELANYLGLKSDSAVRTYMETGKHKYPTKK